MSSIIREPKNSQPVPKIKNFNFLTTITILILVISNNLSRGQETSGFKPSSGGGNQLNQKEDGSNKGKVTEFITGNPNQRNLPQTKSQSLSLYSPQFQNQGGFPQNYYGGNQGNSLGVGGYFNPGINSINNAPNFGLGFDNKGIGFPQQQNFPQGGVPGYPFGQQFPLSDIGLGFPGAVPGKPGVGGGIFPQAPQFPYPQALNPVGGGGGYFQGGFPGPGGLPYPPPFSYPQHQPQQQNPQGVGHLFLGLPRQIKVPGRIEIALLGADAQITCEFPRFLILIQKVYWHHKYDDPYGTYYDGGNRFGPRINVITVDKWKSILQIRNYNEDDFGDYRCLSAAVLPDESPGGSIDNRGGYLLRSPSTTTENTVNAPTTPNTKTLLQQAEKSSSMKSARRNGRDVKFPRLRRSIALTGKSARELAIQKLLLKKESKILGMSSTNHEIQTNSIDESSGGDSDLKKMASEEIYDPYFYGHVPYSTPRNYFPGGNSYSTSTIPPGPGHSRYFGVGGYPSNYYGGGNSLGFGNAAGTQQQQQPFAPYYKPSYGIFTVYQEIKFVTVVRTGNSSIRTNSIQILDL